MSEVNIKIPIDEYIGRSIKEWRKAQQISQQELAEHLNISTMQISHLERGERKWKVVDLSDAADFLNFNLSDLFKNL